MMDYLKARVEQIRSSVSADREELVLATRQQIVEAATRLFLKKGFHKTVTRDIANELGVSQGHIYQYISKKEDILVLMLNAAVEDYKKKLFAVAKTDQEPVEKLCNAIRSYYEILNEHRHKTKVLYEHVAHLDPGDRKIFDNIGVEVIELFRSILSGGIEAGVFDHVDAYVLAYNIVSLGHMWALKGYRF